MLTPLATSMLAMLCEQPMHCYEMYRLMLRRHEDRIVKIKPGSLYHTMDRLAAAGMVVATGTDRAGARPERTTYAITPAGREAMTGWVRGVLAEPVNEYPRLPVALGEAHNLPVDEVVGLLHERIARLEALLATDEVLVAEAYECGVAEAHILDAHFQIDMTRAELGWLNRLLDRLESKELTWSTDR
ncbi:PadR family transcriptional regulator [Pseudonocardia sp. CA-107938]|uniref:PadR family transcriptional regulator n=1 Tax=Pseudonocardia sp. CA-107938 TaxID=3240021 RepID=UPI003D8E1969